MSWTASWNGARRTCASRPPRISAWRAMSLRRQIGLVGNFARPRLEQSRRGFTLERSPWISTLIIVDNSLSVFSTTQRGKPRGVRKEKGSFSFDAASFLFGDRKGDIGTTAAKVVIYEHGKESRLEIDEGVYVWIRSTDPIGDSIWSGDLATNFPELFRLMKRDRTIAIAPWPEVGFSFFLFDESRHGIDEVGDLLVACARI